MEPTEDDVERFGATFQRFMEQMGQVARDDRVSPVRALIDGHIGADTSMVPILSESFQPWDHANVQVAISTWLAAEGRSHELVGLSGQQRHYSSLSDMLDASQWMGVRVGPVDLVNLPVGPHETLPCVQFGLFLIDDGTARFIVLMRGPTPHGENQGVVLEVLSVDEERGRAFLREIRELTVERNVFRGQVISFGESPMGHYGVGPIVFYDRPRVSRDDLVLASGVLEAVERQVLEVANHRERLRASAQHVKRGLLLHGPPGTGKTLTVRYVVSAARDHTVMLLTGGALHLVRHAVALARVLQPTLVVLEDVDLVAEERGMHPGSSNPVLYEVLNVMDGIEEDADVAFLLTTNRADLLEPALAARPGRVDLAVEIALPDDTARRRLLDLYGRGLDLRIEDIGSIVDRTRGVTASFVKELMRKSAVLAAVTSQEGSTGKLTVSDRDVHAALDELLAEESTLTRVLLGGELRTTRRPGTEWMMVSDED
jgi:ATPase family protein associated with various cellular activities (AAA)